MDSRGKVVMESILETKASTILEFFAGLRGTLSVTFEEGTWAARRATLPATRHAATLAPTSAARTASREWEASHHRQATEDSIARAHSLGLSGGSDPDPASFSHQAPGLREHCSGTDNCGKLDRWQKLTELMWSAKRSFKRKSGSVEMLSSLSACHVR